MKDETPLPDRIASISPEERARRQREVDFARGSVPHEGGILSEDIERLNARYIAGELDSDELTAAILTNVGKVSVVDDPPS